MKVFKNFKEMLAYLRHTDPVLKLEEVKTEEVKKKKKGKKK